MGAHDTFGVVCLVPGDWPDIPVGMRKNVDIAVVL